ncbi:hypothetical protein [Ruegeria sp.]|uniref:hypothetical protein n=1 Tax=Ruegeria sp. TaxID=1879320 RepID=UPI003B5B0842
MDQIKPDFEPEELRAAKMASLVMCPFSEEASDAIDAVMDETVSFQRMQGTRVRGLRAETARSLKATIGALLGDLLEAALNIGSGGYCWRESNKDKFKNTNATSRHYETLKSVWPEMGLMDVVNGFRGSDDFDGEIYHPNTPNKRWATRLRATPLLLERLAEYGITPKNLTLHFRSDRNKARPITLKAAKISGEAKPRIITDYTRSSTSAAIEADVNEINAFLNEWEYSFGAPPVLFRVFNDGDRENYQWDSGGRFYGSESTYINWKSEERRGILIGGEPTAEIDIKACQLTMLLGLMGFDYEVGVDLYQIDGLDREEVKQEINVIVGKGRIGGRTSPVIGKILERYPFLNDLETRGLNSLRLQAIDSAIMNQTLLILKRQYCIPALPVHDCLIVRVRDVDTAQEVFSEAFYDHIGLRPTLTVDH